MKEEREGDGRAREFVAQGGCACCAGREDLWVRDGRLMGNKKATHGSESLAGLQGFEP